MAVTITLGELAHQLRVSTTDAAVGVQSAYVTVLNNDLAAATEWVEARAPLAPTASQNGAVVRICGYWLESPAAVPQRYGYNAWLHSGAAALLAPYIERRAEAI